MRIGIVSECIREEEKALKRFWIRKYVTETISDINNPFEVVVLKLPYTLEKIRTMSGKRRASVFRKTVGFLEKEAVDSVVLSNGLKDYQNEIACICQKFSVADGFKLFYKFVPDAVRRISDRCSLKLLDAKVCISSMQEDRITEYLVREMCYDIKNLTICTNDVKRVKLFCDDFAKETGFFPRVVDINNCASRKVADIFVDIDENKVRIGRNVVIDGVNFDFKLNGYPVNMLDIVACLKEIDVSDRVISYNCGKNKLTL